MKTNLFFEKNGHWKKTLSRFCRKMAMAPFTAHCVPDDIRPRWMTNSVAQKEVEKL